MEVATVDRGSVDGCSAAPIGSGIARKWAAADGGGGGRMPERKGKTPTGGGIGRYDNGPEVTADGTAEGRETADEAGAIE